MVIVSLQRLNITKERFLCLCCCSVGRTMCWLRVDPWLLFLEIVIMLKKWKKLDSSPSYCFVQEMIRRLSKAWCTLEPWGRSPLQPSLMVVFYVNYHSFIFHWWYIRKKKETELECRIQCFCVFVYTHVTCTDVRAYESISCWNREKKFYRFPGCVSVALMYIL